MEQPRFYVEAEIPKQTTHVQQLLEKGGHILAQRGEQIEAAKAIRARLQQRIAEINGAHALVPQTYGENVSAYRQQHDMLPNVYKMGCSSSIGRRSTNEDQEYVHDSGFFCAVFDGHAGSEAAISAKNNVEIMFQKKCADPETSLKLNALELDSVICAENQKSGCTFGFAGWFDGSFYIGNIGDVRVVSQHYATTDHKPVMERDRLQMYGSEIMQNRVNGVLATSRALGDFEMKTQGVVAELDVQRLEGEREPWFLVACDGLWDVLSNEQVREFIQAAIAGECLDLDYVAIDCDADAIVRDPEEKHAYNLKNAFLCYLHCSYAEGDYFIQRIRGVKMYPLGSDLVELAEESEPFESRVAKALGMTGFRMGSQDNISCVFALLASQY